MKIAGIVNEVSVEFHDELNPALWENNEIKLDVQVRLLEIAKKFIKFLNVSDLKLVDIYFMGSNAAYVYTHFSDIDLHIIVDDPDESLKELYDAKKRLWNDQHDISIKGYDVELYVQDIKDPNASMGIYSLLQNKWIKKPEKVEATIDDASVQQKFKYLARKIDRGIRKRDLNYLDNIATEIKTLRKSGLQRAGEFSVENLAFKELRNGGYLEKLSDARQELEDKALSLDEAVPNDDRAQRLRTRSRIRKGIGTKHVYSYEVNVLYEIKRLAQQRSLRTLTNIANKIWAKHYKGKRRVPTIRFGKGDTSLGYPLSYTEGYSLIELAPGQQDILTLIHELVHAIGPSLHGTNFTKLYYEMLKDYLPEKVRDEVYQELVLRHGQKLKPYYKKMMAEGFPQQVTKEQLRLIAQYADKLFKAAGLDVIFTKHFQDRANDPRNENPIKPREILDVFNKAYKQLDQGKEIARLGPEAQAVLKDMEKDLNMPFVLKWDDRTQELDLVFKTVMRKRNFMTSNPTLKVENNDYL